VAQDLQDHSVRDGLGTPGSHALSRSRPAQQEGSPTTFDNAAGQRFVYNAEHFEIGLGYAITRKAIDDNLYKAEFGPSNDA